MECRDCEGALEARIGYAFGQASLLRQALTHKSFSNEQPEAASPDSERLEFLGDAVLDLVVSHWIFRNYPDRSEGELTLIRAEVVSEKGLAAVARRLQLGKLLLLGRGEEKSGGRDKDSLLADALEALLGAIFCDGGLVAAQQVIESLFEEPIRLSAKGESGVDYKTRLQEILQGLGGRPPEYVILLAEGPAHERQYTAEVRFAGEGIGRGEGRTKKSAEQAAARQALERSAWENR